MSISRIAATVALVLTAAASLAISPVGAQEGEDEIVSTGCAAGHVNECGWEPARESCAWDFSIGWNATSIFGVTVSFKSCTYVGEKRLYKDFIRGKSAGACVAHPPAVPADNTRVGGDTFHELEDPSEC